MNSKEEKYFPENPTFLSMSKAVGILFAAQFMALLLIIPWEHMEVLSNLGFILLTGFGYYLLNKTDTAFKNPAIIFACWAPIMCAIILLEYMANDSLANLSIAMSAVSALLLPASQIFTCRALLPYLRQCKDSSPRHFRWMKIYCTVASIECGIVALGYAFIFIIQQFGLSLLVISGTMRQITGIFYLLVVFWAWRDLHAVGIGAAQISKI